MPTRDYGGPAFPVAPTGQGDPLFDGDPGMSLCDWFAGQALKGVLAYEGPRGRSKELAAVCYYMADAMLKEREK